MKNNQDSQKKADVEWGWGLNKYLLAFEFCFSTNKGRGI